jgi:transcriptional regulator with XRE-family HTH domain
MAKRKIRHHRGALAEVLKRQNMTQTDAANASGIDRKTLAKIDRGEDVKEETLQKLARKLSVPTTHFDPPAGSSVDQVDSQPDDPRWLSLTLRKIDAERLGDLLKANGWMNWQLNVHTVDDGIVPLLEQLEDAVKDLHRYLQFEIYDPEHDASLRLQLDGLKRSKHVVLLLEELAKCGLGILGAEYLAWNSETETEWHDENLYTIITYTSRPTAVLSIEGHPVQARRAKVWRGTEPPRFAPDLATIIKVNGVKLERDPAVIQKEKEKAALVHEKFWSELEDAAKKASNREASSEDSNA